MSQEVSLDHTIYSVTCDCPTCHTQQSEPALQCVNCNAILVIGLRKGTLIANKYTYICPIGTGGMGLIVKALDNDSKDEVAVKLLLRNTNASDNRRFQQEARAASMLTHKNIIHVRDFGFCEDDSPYMVMDYVFGNNLADLISQKGSLDPGEALEILDQICAGMSFAHSRGIVHRDLKPSNIMLTGHNKDLVKIVDFGIAKIMEANLLEKNLTQTGQVLGSPLYMSPEQALGRKIDTRTDIYSAGCVLFHALTGAPPIAGSSFMETLFKHVHETPLSLSEASLGKSFDPLLEEIVARTLRKDPEQRYQSFEELRTELKRCCYPAIKGHPERSMKDDLNIKADTKRSKTTRIATIAFAAVGCLIAGAGYFFIDEHRKPPTPAALAPPVVPVAAVARPAAVQPSETDRSKSVKNTNDERAEDTSGAIPLQLGSEWTASQMALNEQLHESKRTITLAENSATNDDLEYLARQITHLKASVDGVDVRVRGGCEVSDAGLKVLMPLPLKELTLDGTQVTGEGLESIGRMNSLEELHLHGLHGTNPQNVAYLKQLKKLKILDLSHCKELAGSDLAILASMKGLTTLDLDSIPHLGDDVLPYIITLPHLAKLDISWTQLREPALEQLGRVKSLRTLNLEGLAISDKWLKSVSKLPQLWNLNLSRTNIDSSAVKTLSQMRTLNKLYVSDCPNLQENDISRLRIALGSSHVFTSKPEYYWDIR